VCHAGGGDREEYGRGGRGGRAEHVYASLLLPAWRLRAGCVPEGHHAAGGSLVYESRPGPADRRLSRGLSSPTAPVARGDPAGLSHYPLAPAGRSHAPEDLGSPSGVRGAGDLEAINCCIAEPRRAPDYLQRPLRSRFRQQVTPGVDMICMATACAKRTRKTRLLAQALSKSSDFLICTQGKS